MKLISAIALIGLLAACTAGATTPSEQALPTTSSSTGVVSSPAASMGTTATDQTCTDAFASLKLDASTTDLNSVGDQLDATISACPTIDSWAAALQKAAPKVDITAALAFLQTRCGESTLSDTVLCKFVGPASS